MLGHRKLEVPDYLAILKRRGVLIAVCALLFPILAVGVAGRLPARYVSQTLVIIEQQKVPDNYVKPVISTDQDSRLASMKEQILSRSRLEPIITRYGLYPDKRLSMDDRVDLARKSIDIKPIHSQITDSSGLPGFFISFTASDARTAQLVCGEITSLFLNANLRSREDSAEGTTAFLKSQLDNAKRELDTQDAKLAAFQAQYAGKLPDQSEPNMNMLTSLNTQLEASTEALSRMEQDKTYQQSMLSQALQQSGGNVSTPGASATTHRTGTPEQEAELVRLRAQQADLTSHYTANYPDVIAVKRQIADLRAAMSPETVAGAPAVKASAPVESPGVQQLRAQLRAADQGIAEKRREQQQVQAQVSLYQSRIAATPLVEEQYKELTRDNATAQKFYDDLLAKMNSSKMATDLELQQQGEQFSVMDAPNLPDAPTFPNKKLFAIGGLLLGLLLGCSLAAFLEYSDTSLRSERDVWSFTHLPTLAVLAVAGVMEDEPHPGFFSRFKRKSPPSPQAAPPPPTTVHG
jgi:polysaccharide chain length determinant protein (PEP-CTERM system associated)